MRKIQRRFLVLAGAALAVMATAAPAASAMEVRDANGALCPAVSPAIDKTNVISSSLNPPKYQSGGCTVHMTPNVSGDNEGETFMRWGTGNTDRCKITYDLHIGPDGWGYATGHTYAAGNFSVCGSWSPLASYPSRVIVPGNVNPAFGAGKFFSAANAETEFNSSWAGVRKTATGEANGSGNLSLNVTKASPLTMDNQFTGTGFTYGNGSYARGSWVGNVGLTITP